MFFFRRSINKQKVSQKKKNRLKIPNKQVLKIAMKFKHVNLFPAWSGIFLFFFVLWKA